MPLQQLIAQAKEPAVSALTEVAQKNNQELIQCSQSYLTTINTYLNDIQKTYIEEEKHRNISDNFDLLRDATEALYKQLPSIENYSDLLRLDKIISQKDINTHRQNARKMGNYDKSQGKAYKAAKDKVKEVQFAISQLNEASNKILENAKLKTTQENKKVIDVYIQQAMIASEQYQSQLYKHMNDDVSGTIIFQCEGEIFQVINLEVAVGKLVYASEGSRGSGFKGRFNSLPKGISDLSADELKSKWGLEKIFTPSQGSSNQKQTYEIMKLFLQATKDVPISGNLYDESQKDKIISQYKISRGQGGRYDIYFDDNNAEYYGVIGNRGDLSEIYMAAIMSDINLNEKGNNPLESFILNTKVDSVSGALAGDFRATKDGKITEYSAKSAGASYTLINQMIGIASSIVGMGRAGLEVEISQILSQSYDNQAKNSANGAGRNKVIEIAKKKVQQELSKILTI